MTHNYKSNTNLLDMVNDNGVLAIQVPMYNIMLASYVTEKVSSKQRWKKQTTGVSKLFTFHESDFYYEVLADKVKSIDLWTTSYYHIMDSHKAIFEMLKSTGIKHFLDRLDTDEEHIDFENNVLEELRKVYPIQKDGKVLLPFERLFFIGYK